jgi:hypothetical protein
MEMDTWVFKQGGALIVGWDIMVDGNIIRRLICGGLWFLFYFIEHNGP